MSMNEPRIETTSDVATIVLNGGDLVYCFQARARAFRAVVTARERPVIVVARRSQIESIPEDDLQTRVLERAAEIAKDPDPRRADWL